MPNYIIITTTDNLVVDGDRYARDDGGDLHVYPAGDHTDPTTTVDASEFVAIIAASDVDDETPLDYVLSNGPFVAVTTQSE